MTIEELIKHLQCLSADTQVLVDGYANGCDEVVEVREIELIGREKFEDSPFQAKVSEWPTKRIKP